MNTHLTIRCRLAGVRDYYTVTLHLGFHPVVLEITSDPCSHVPMQQVAEFVAEWHTDVLDAVFVYAERRCISYWPPQWQPKLLQIRAISCPPEAFQGEFSNLTLELDEMPSDFSPRVDKLDLFTRVMPAVTCFTHALVKTRRLRWLTYKELPVWASRTDGAWQRNSEFPLRGMLTRGLEDLDLLYHLLIQGLSKSGSWQQWLTKGLYDPRLLLTIVSFCIDRSDCICKSGR